MSANTSGLGLDSSGHPDVETIAEYLEDLLSPDVAAQLQVHFDDCPECLDTRDAIDEIRSLLGETETPQLPVDVGIRIDAALAAEALLGSTAPTAVPGRPLTSMVGRAAAPAPPRSGRPSRRAARAASGPAGSRPGGTGRRRLRQAALGLAALAVVGLVSTAVLRMDSSVSSPTSAGAAARPGLPNGGASSFSAAGFPQQIQQLLTHPQANAVPKSHPQNQTERSSASGEAETPALAPSSAAPACVTQAIGRPGEQPIATGRGSYQGVPVYAVVYPDQADPLHSVDAYLVDASCTGASGSTGRIVLHQTVPRG